MEGSSWRRVPAAHKRGNTLGELPDRAVTACLGKKFSGARYGGRQSNKGSFDFEKDTAKVFEEKVLENTARPVKSKSVAFWAGEASKAPYAKGPARKQHFFGGGV